MTSPSFKTLSTIAAELAAGLASPLALCVTVISHVHVHNPAIGAYSQIVEEAARNEARASEERRKNGEPLSPLDGVPIAIKNLIDTTPAKCSAGLEHLVNYQPAQDAIAVRKLREVGAVVLGVTETDPGAFATRTEKVTNPLPSQWLPGVLQVVQVGALVQQLPLAWPLRHLARIPMAVFVFLVLVVPLQDSNLHGEG